MHFLGTSERQECADWWIEYFDNLRDSGLDNDASVIQRECLTFCFMDLIEVELNRIAGAGEEPS